MTANEPPGETCWVEAWLTAKGRRWRASVIDTATGETLFVTPDTYTTRLYAVAAARQWAQEHAMIEVDQ